MSTGIILITLGILIFVGIIVYFVKYIFNNSFAKKLHNDLLEKDASIFLSSIDKLKNESLKNESMEFRKEIYFLIEEQQAIISEIEELKDSKKILGFWIHFFDSNDKVEKAILNIINYLIKFLNLAFRFSEINIENEFREGVIETLKSYYEMTKNLYESKNFLEIQKGTNYKNDFVELEQEIIKLNDLIDDTINKDVLKDKLISSAKQIQKFSKTINSAISYYSVCKTIKSENSLLTKFINKNISMLEKNKLQHFAKNFEKLDSEVLELEKKIIKSDFENVIDKLTILINFLYDRKMQIVNYYLKRLIVKKWISNFGQLIKILTEAETKFFKVIDEYSNIKNREKLIKLNKNIISRINALKIKNFNNNEVESYFTEINTIFDLYNTYFNILDEATKILQAKQKIKKEILIELDILNEYLMKIDEIYNQLPSDISLKYLSKKIKFNERFKYYLDEVVKSKKLDNIKLSMKSEINELKLIVNSFYEKISYDNYLQKLSLQLIIELNKIGENVYSELIIKELNNYAKNGEYVNLFQKTIKLKLEKQNDFKKN